MLKTTKILIPILLVTVFLGAFGAWDRLVNGKLNLNFGSYIPWGLWVGLYIYLVGLSGGAFLVVFLHHGLGIRFLRRASLYALPLALTTLGAGLILVLMDLGHIGRFWKLYAQPSSTSLLAWMVWIYTIYSMVLVFMAFALAKGKEQWLKLLSVVGFLLMVTFGGGEGALFGVLGAKPYWNSGLLPIRFLFSAFLSGVALVGFMFVLFRHWSADREHSEVVSFLRYLIMALLAVNLLTEFAEFSVAQYAAVPDVLEAYRVMVFGAYWWVFWIVQIVIGLLVPAVLLVPGWGKKSFNFGLGSLLIALGYAGTKQNIVLTGLAVPDFRALPEAFVHDRLSVVYFPSATEWLVAIGVIAAAGLVFLVMIETLWFLRGRGESMAVASAAGLEPWREGRLT